MSAEEAAEILARMREGYEPPEPKKTNGKHADDEAVVFGDECRYPASFYDVDSVLGERLRHLRAIAWSRQRSPTATVGVSFARMSAAMPHTVKLDPVVGSEQPVTMFVATVGGSGSGKGDAAANAGRAFPSARLELLSEGITDHLPPGSGQGLVDCLFEMLEDEIEVNGKKKTVRRKQQTHHNAFFEMDEGEALGALAKDSILLETMRTIWSGKTVGQVNVDVERRRVLPGGTYTYGINIQVQPTKAAKLIEDDAGGTPQRFLWVPTQDPSIEAATGENLGALDWLPPSAMSLDRIATTPSNGEYVRHYLTQDPAIIAEIRAHDLAVQRGELILDPLDAHALNMRRRVAALLALLDDTLHVTLVHWELSAVVMSASKATRDVVLGAVQTEQAKLVEGRRSFQSSVAVASDEARERQQIVKTATRIATLVHAEPERWTFSMMRRDGVSGRHREVYVDAIEHAVEMRWILVEEIDVVGTKGGGGTARVLRSGPKKP